MKNIRFLIVILAILKFLLPFILQNGAYQPFRDEYLYLDQANHLDWGYLENPPNITALAWVTNMLGSNIVWIKLWPALFGALTFYLTSELALAFGGKSFSVFLVFMAMVVTSILRIHYILNPVFLDLFFSTAMVLTLLRYVQTERNYWLYLFAVSAGLGLLSRYSTGFYMIALIVGLLCSKQLKVFINYHFYIALILIAAIVAPNYYWQSMHNFPVAHIFQDMQDDYSRSTTVGSFLNDQFLMLLPCFYLWVMGILYIILTKKGLTRYLFILTSLIFIQIFLIYIHAKGTYALNTYPALIALGAYNFDRITRKYMKFLRYGMITFSALFGLYVSGLAIPFLPPSPLADLYSSKQFLTTGILRWDDQQNHALPQEIADMLGWKEITDRTNRIYSTFTDDDKAHTLIYTDRYGLAGALNYFGKSIGLPTAYCEKGSYMMWIPDTMNIKVIILLSHDSRRSNDEVFKHFKMGDQMDDINIPYTNESGLKITLYTLPDGQQNEALKQAIALRKESLFKKQNSYQ